MNSWRGRRSLLASGRLGWGGRLERLGCRHMRASPLMTIVNPDDHLGACCMHACITHGASKHAHDARSAFPRQAGNPGACASQTRWCHCILQEHPCCPRMQVHQNPPAGPLATSCMHAYQ